MFKKADYDECSPTKVLGRYDSRSLLGLAADLFSEYGNYGCLSIEQTERICREARVVPSMYVLSFIYLKRLETYNREFLATVKPLQLFAVTLMITGKFLYDDYPEMWASSARLTVPQLNKLERDFLRAIKWKLYVSKNEFLEKIEEIEKTLTKPKRNTIKERLFNVCGILLVVGLFILTCNILTRNMIKCVRTPQPDEPFKLYCH